MHKYLLRDGSQRVGHDWATCTHSHRKNIVKSIRVLVLYIHISVLFKILQRARIIFCNLIKKKILKAWSSVNLIVIQFLSQKFCSFVFRSMVHFELIVRSVSRFSLFFNVEAHCSSTICWKDCPFSIKDLLHQLPFSFVKEQLILSVCIYLWALDSVPLICTSVLSAITHCLDYCSFLVSLEVR